MFKEIQRGFGRFFTTQRTIVLIIFLVLGFVLYSYSSSKSYSLDRMTTGSPQPSNTPSGLSLPGPSILPVNSASVPQVQGPPEPAGNGYSMRPVANPSDLLPKDSNSQWGELNTLNQGNIVMPDLLQAGYHIGLDTIGQTLRNANLQERSDPIIPKQNVGPWYQSTIEPDFGRVPLELGQGQR